MTNYDEALVRLGVTGALHTFDRGSITIPVNMAPWPTGAVDLGYISDEGITENREADSEQFVPWQTNAPVRVETTSEIITWETTLWTTSYDTVSVYFKVRAEDMEYDPESEVVSFVDGDKKPRDLRGWGIDVIDGVYARRAIIPNGEITERGGLSYRKDQLIGYPVTLTAYPGPEGWSVKREFREGWQLPTGTTPTP
ncbi:phage tail tube protein [Rhodococcus pyridinivorans]|uniref:Major tail protein n=1 Tax=Rhodococcus pyridinivorans TaxID=103816 RepID=A0A7M2XP51_9NOCA|nr:hypothetical protein [Rhodococcus pyridinivorans]QOV99509.1 hypothetical protein INP59_03660 [Rhodococcus pyridinivorans]